VVGARAALKPGANVITVTARDAAGNTNTDSITVTMTDGAAPVVTIAAPRQRRRPTRRRAGRLRSAARRAMRSA
jgi:hypothetical protein